MSAPDDAITLGEESSGWKKVDLNFTCFCGHKGRVSELLCVDDDETVWCPVCKASGFTWDD